MCCGTRERFYWNCGEMEGARQFCLEMHFLVEIIAKQDLHWLILDFWRVFLAVKLLRTSF